jgi:CheY-like chemotaxis protein
MAPPFRLLLVDDSPEIARVVQHLARRAGQEVVCRGDVPAAWDYLHRGDVPRLDLILLDVNLPGASGLDLFRRLRQEGESRALLPVALFVSWSVPETIAEGLDEGIDFVLSKDLLARPDDWKERVEEVLDLAAHPPECESVASGGPLARHPPPGPSSAEGGRPPARWEPELQSAISALRHPLLRQLGDEILQALWRRSLRRALGGRASPAEVPQVDVWGSAAILIQTLASLTADCPTFPAALALALAYQAAGLVGKAASEPLRTALAGLVAKG